MAFVVADLYARVRHLVPEMLRFGVVGGIGAVFDLGGAALLHGAYHVGPLEAKGISTATAMVITYLGSRFWTFKDSESQDMRRETALFVGLNLVGLLIAEAVVGFVTYVAGVHGQLGYNFASFLGTGFGTIFRYVTYRKWVFPTPAAQVPAAAEPAPWRSTSGAPPWELGQAPLTPMAQAPVSALAPVSAAVYPAPVAGEPGADWDPALAPTMSWTAPAPQPAPVPAFDFFSADSPAADVSAPRAPVPRVAVPTRRPYRPAHAPSRGLRWSSGGRHRKG